MNDGQSGRHNCILGSADVPFPAGGIVHLYPGAHLIGAFLVNDIRLRVVIAEPKMFSCDDTDELLARPNKFETEYLVHVINEDAELPVFIDPPITLIVDGRIFAIGFTDE